MNYSPFSLEQIRESFRNYDELSEIFNDLIPEESKGILSEILNEGGYNGFAFRTGMSKDSPLIEGQRRFAMAYLLLRNPNTFEEIIQNRINVFHGTNANALPSIIKYGVNSIDESKKNGVDVVTGEQWSRINGGRNFVSFTDILDIAEGYATLKPVDGSELLSFEVVIGTTIADVKAAGTCVVSSDVPEIGVRSCLPNDSIKSICVPTDKVDFVKKMIDDLNIKVLPVDDYDQKFYYIDEFGIIYIFPERIEQLKKDLVTAKAKKEFKNEEVKQLMKNSKISSIKHYLENVVGMFGYSKGESYDGKVF
ncbi:MAG: hypothetical protein IJ475_01210 [Bacilli bacterium]|nr:hypothetical protein [Bacilli bacterium]